MSTFNFDLSAIRAEVGDIIVAKLDMTDIPYGEVEDFSEALDKLAVAFPKNQIVLMSKNDEIDVIRKGSSEKVLKHLVRNVKCPDCHELYNTHDIHVTCPLKANVKTKKAKG